MRTLISAGVIFLLFTGCAYGRSKYVKMAEKVQPKTTMIQVETVVEVMGLSFTEKGIEINKATQTVTLRGSGVFISPAGHVLSCDHLLDKGEIQRVQVCDYYSNCYDADILYRESKRDLSLLKVNAKESTAYALLADPRSLEVGEEVIAVGNPYGLEFTVTRGIISSLNRDLGDPAGYNLVQTDAPINPGNSGGPLFNMRGELVGINVRGVPNADGLGFAAESGQILEFLTRFRGLEKAFSIPRAWQRLAEFIGIHKTAP